MIDDCPCVSREELKVIFHLDDDELDTAIKHLEEMNLFWLCDCMPPQWILASLNVVVKP